MNVVNEPGSNDIHLFIRFRIVILMRGIPGSGKSYISKMIKDKEQELGGSARVLTIDDYFMTETDSDTANGQKVI